MPSSRKRLQSAALVQMEAHTDVLNQKYLLQKEQGFKPIWAAFFINFNPRSVFLQRASFGAPALKLLRCPWMLYRDLLPSLGTCSSAARDPVCGIPDITSRGWECIVQHLLGTASLLVRHGFVSLREREQCWRHEGEATTLEWTRVVCPAHVPGFVKLVTNSLSGQSSFFLSLFFFFPSAGDWFL